MIVVFPKPARKWTPGAISSASRGIRDSPSASGPAVLGAPGAPGFGTLMQGYTEASNVDPVSEITNLIVAQRAYEMNSKVVTAADQMLQQTSQMAQG